jgi:hypothetical protein
MNQVASLSAIDRKVPPARKPIIEARNAFPNVKQKSRSSGGRARSFAARRRRSEATIA